MTAPFIKENWHKDLHVIAVISNPRRYRTRYDLYKEFEKHVNDSGATLWTVETAFGNRSHAISDKSNPRHIQLRTGHELWHKENMINLAIQRLPSDWKYVAWVDADITFVRPDWAEETIHKLQHYDVVQMFTEAQDVCPNYVPLRRHRGYVWCFHNGIEKSKDYDTYYCERRASIKYDFTAWHPGFAWAARRSAIDHLGGLIDFAILGAADNHMAKSLFGDGLLSCHPDVHPNYKESILQWQRRALKYIRRNVGYVDGLILHHWHGRKADRKYWDRWKILVDHQYDPAADLKKDWQGLYQLTDRSWQLRDAIRNYFAQRNEDDLYVGDERIM